MTEKIMIMGSVDNEALKMQLELLAAKSDVEIVILDDMDDLPKEVRIPIKPYTIEMIEPLEYVFDDHEFGGRGRMRTDKDNAKKKLKAKRRAQRHARSRQRRK